MDENKELGRLPASGDRAATPSGPSQQVVSGKAGITDAGAGFDANAFLAFCRSKPADEVYAYFNPTCCALSQYGRERLGYASPRAGADYVFDGQNRDSDRYGPSRVECPRVVADAITNGRLCFGALADRLEAALAEQSE